MYMYYKHVYIEMYMHVHTMYICIVMMLTIRQVCQLCFCTSYPFSLKVNECIVNSTGWSELLQRR